MSARQLLLRAPVLAVMLAGVSWAGTAGSGDAVLTVRLCERSEMPECTVVVSRQQFEDLASAVSPASLGKEHFAKMYAELLAFDHAARELGIDQSVEYRERARWLEAKTLADLLRRRLEKESAAVSDAEIQAYYGEHLAQFEEVKLSRIVVPKQKLAADGKTFEENARRVAGEIGDRAARGEDPERLQKEAYEILGFGGVAPATDVGSRRRASLPAEAAAEIFSFDHGGVSKVADEPYSFVIYRVESKRRLPVEAVREEIRREVANQKLERALGSVSGKLGIEMNADYFRASKASE